MNDHRSRDVIEKIVRNVPGNAIVVMMVDVTDFESSVVPELFEAFSRRGTQCVVALNKMDCLPVTQTQWPSVLAWSSAVSKLLRTCRGLDGKPDIVPIAAMSELGFEKLESRLQQYMSSRDSKSVYIVGRTNTGKSTFVTRFLRFIGYRHLGTVHYKRGVGGLTRSPMPNTTCDFINIDISKNLRIIDTPGIPTNHSIHEKLICSEDFRDVSVGQKLQPLSFSVKEGKSLLVGALARLEVVSGVSATISCFISPKITLHVCNTGKAEELLKRKAGTFLYPPHLSPEMGGVHPIVSEEWVKHRVRVFGGPSVSKDDISIPGLGWFSINGNGHKVIDVWLPPGVELFRRPSMLPKFIRRFGATPFHFRHRGRSLAMNKRKKLLVQSIRDNARRDEWRSVSQDERKSCSSPPIIPKADDSFLSEDATEGFRVDADQIVS
jgi:ribosome biogenesis GTPase A